MYLGIDLGTSGVKALLIDERQAIIASANAPLTVERPHPGWSEQSPQSWIDATGDALDELARSHSDALAATRGIGLSGHMHGATVLGEDDAPLRPCIMWNDTRSHAEAADLDADPKFRAITGNIVFPGFTAPKLVWMQNHEPDLFGRVRKVLLPKDYLRLWLAGEHISEMSDSAGTSWLDTGKRQWSPELLSATGLDESHMPALVEGSQPGGTLRAELAARWGMGNNVVIAGGAGDNAAAAIGMGTVSDGQAFASLGTSGVLFAANAGYRPDPDSAVHAFCHALPQTWHQMGVILSATDALNWLSGITGRDQAALAGELGEDLRAPGQITFLPYLSGERTPHNDAAIRGNFSGLSHGDDRQALTQALLEGVAFAFRDCQAALQSAGTALARVTAVGGGSRSAYWLSALATALGIPVDLPAEGEFGAAFGAARLGLMAAEGADAQTVCTPPAIAQTFQPVTSMTAAYGEAYARYRALYPALKGTTA